jgi:hypothetical protein
MPDTIPNLWPKEIKVDVQTPLAILRVQAELLSKVTRGILEGDVETESSKEKMQHRLVVIAPAYNGYRHTLVTVVYNSDLPYPAEVRAAALAEKVARPSVIDLSSLGSNYNTVYPTANSDEQMQALVKRALHSDQTLATILSLIAKSNEANATSRSTNGEKKPETDDGAKPKSDPG